MTGTRRVPPVPTAERLAALLGAAGLRPATDGAVAALRVHLELLYRWNAKYNLTAIRVPDEAVRRHVAEALEAVPEMPAAGRLLDLGSGNGYPALPLLITIPGLSGTLVEAREAKAAFLRAVIRETGLAGRVDVLQERLASPEHVPPDATVVTMRGFPDPVAWTADLVRRPGLRVLAWLSREDADEAVRRIGPAAARVRPLTSHPGGALLVAG